ncbi:zinc finger BED domain-containing protein 4-like isoform X2 [Alosa sapidissima]|uniref:zinc finger BED domain-containing protein 4-like isoform X2 n=2 Tax=Alosa sapidissima TaxID=34773 RepID=UPI001C093BB8|nr:zinc finger BED domain-containing protein 4-like isoform X2 [Alosa sapidissima]
MEMEDPCGPVDMNHKQVCLDLEKATQCITQAFRHEVVKNQELCMMICRLEEKEAETGRSLTEQVESNKQLKLKIDELQKHLEEKNNSLTQANQTVSLLKNELRDLLQQLKDQRSNRAVRMVLERLHGWESHLNGRHTQQIKSRSSPLQSEQLMAADEPDQLMSEQMMSSDGQIPLILGIKEENSVHGYEECSQYEGADPRMEQNDSSDADTKPKQIQTSLVSSEGLEAPASDDDDDDDDDEDYEVDDDDGDGDDDDEDYGDYSRSAKIRKRGNSRTDQTMNTSRAVKADLVQDPAMDSSPPARKRRAVTSAIWEHFTTSSTDPTKVICKLCKTILSRGKNQKRLTTSSMHNHIHFKHPALSKTPPTQGHAPHHLASTLKLTAQKPRQDLMHNAQLPIMAVYNSNTLYPDDHPTAKQITEALGEMICQDLLPFSVVENKGLLRLLAVTAPRYRVPSPMHFSCTVVPNLYNNIRAKVKKSLLSIEGDVVHCTTDIWTSKSSTNAYLSLTGHWAGREVTGSESVSHRRVAVLLGLSVINLEHTAASVLEKLQCLIAAWQREISDRFSVQFFVTDDDASNAVKAIADGGFGRIRCVACALHSVVTGALTQCRAVSHAITIGRKITAFVHSSNDATVKLHQIQVELGLPLNTLVLDVSTRWNSTFQMLRRLLEQKSAIVAMGTQLDSAGSLSHHQWELIEATLKILQPFEEATRNAFEDSTSLSSVIPCVQALKASIGNLKTTAGVQALPEARKLATSLEALLVEQFQPVLQDPTGPYFKATLLDPRFKMMPSSLLSESDFNRLKAEVVSEVEERLGHLVGEPDDAAATSDLSTAAAEEDTVRKSLFWGAMQSMSQKSERSAKTHLSSSSIVENYLAECNTVSLSSDPLVTYWSRKMVTQPALAHVAVKYLTCPPTSVSSEQLFSTAGDVVSPHCSTLLPAHAQQLVFTKFNLEKFE